MGAGGLRPNLLLRSGHFIDSLIDATGLSFDALEERIRVNQYERVGLLAPDYETVRDYFRLHRSVAFEPRVGRTEDGAGGPSKTSRSPPRKAPWLLAAELEFPGCSYAFFHPLGDLLFGRFESSYYWGKYFETIPVEWIEREEVAGNCEFAQELREMNKAKERRVHRVKPPTPNDKLDSIRHPLLRLRPPHKTNLFSRTGLSPYWDRRFRSVDEEVSVAAEETSLDAFTAIFGLALEAAEIGDIARFYTAREATFDYFPRLEAAPGCRRISGAVKVFVEGHFESNIRLRRYMYSDYFGYGLPISWRAQLAPRLIARTYDRFGLDQEGVTLLDVDLGGCDTG